MKKMKKIFTLFCVAFLAISVFAQTYNGGTWYSLYAESEITNVVVGSDIATWDVFAPASGTVTFDYKKLAFLTVNGKVRVETSADGSNFTEIGSVSYSDYKNYKSGSVSDIPANIKKMKFVNTSTGSQTKNVKLPLAKHILLSGGDFGKSSVSKTFTQETRIGESSNIRADFRSFLTNGDIYISLTEGDAEVFRLGAENNTTGVLSSSTAGNIYAVGANACASANGSAAACSAGQLGKIDNYSFQIYFCPKAVGEATGKITITDGTNTATISLKGTGIKMETLEVDVPLSFCQGSSVEYHGKTYTAATSEQINATGAIRDTVYNVTVTVLQPTTGTAEKTITVGDEVEWNGIDLSEYTVGSHEVEFKTKNVAGCDSTVTLTLTVNKQEILEVPVELSFCAGGSEWYRGTEYAEAGVYDVPAEGAVRDTLYKVNVIVLQPTTGTDEMTIVYGDEVEWNGIALKDSTVGVHYVEFVTTNAVGCDSTVTLTLTVNKLETLEVPVDLSFCAGGSEWYRGVEYSEAGVFDVPVEGATRDTLYKINVTVLQPSSEAVEMEMTVGDDLEWNGIALKDSTVGVYTIVYETTNVVGCDSTVTLTLTVNKMDTLKVDTAFAFCEGGSEDFHGKTYTEAIKDTILAIGETRDTLYFVNVTVLQPSSEAVEMEMTVGDDLEWNGIALKDSTVGVHYVEFVTTNVAGCDSTVTLTLTVNKLEMLETEYQIEICEGSEQEYRGVIYNEEGRFTLDVIEGETRDTLLTVVVTVNAKGYEEILLTDTIGNVIELPEGEWTLGDDVVSGPYEIQETDIEGLVFVQVGETEKGCEDVTKIIVTVEEKPQDQGDPTGFETIEGAQKAVKEFRNGVLYIRRGEKVYTASGELVK